MKRISLIFALPLLFSFVLFFASLGHAANAANVLTYEEWSSLSEEGQLQYLKGLQSVVSGMDERSEYFAKEASSSSRSPASTGARGVMGGKAIQEVKELTTRPIKPAETDAAAKIANRKMTEIDALVDQATKAPPNERATLLKKAAEMTEETRFGLMKIQNSSSFEESYKKWKDTQFELELKVRSAKKILDNKDVSLTAKLDRIAEVDTNFNKVSALAAQGKAQSPETKKFVTIALGDKKTYLKAEKDYAEALAPMASKTNLKKDEFFRCMYAGFVLKENCKAPSVLPGDMNLLGINKENFICDKSQVLCNPLLFGGNLSCPLVDVKKEKDPAKNKEAIAANAKCLNQMTGQCQPKSRSATSECLKNANKIPGNLQITAALIHANPKEWNEYANSFHGLCDESKIDKNAFTKKKGEVHRQDQERVENDIALTCEWARTRLAKLRDEAGIDLKAINTTKIKVEKKTVTSDKKEAAGKK